MENLTSPFIILNKFTNAIYSYTDLCLNIRNVILLRYAIDKTKMPGLN